MEFGMGCERDPRGSRIGLRCWGKPRRSKGLSAGSGSSKRLARLGPAIKAFTPVSYRISSKILVHVFTHDIPELGVLHLQPQKPPLPYLILPPARSQVTFLSTTSDATVVWKVIKKTEKVDMSVI